MSLKEIQIVVVPMSTGWRRKILGDFSCQVEKETSNTSQGESLFTFEVDVLGPTTNTSTTIDEDPIVLTLPFPFTSLRTGLRII